MESLERDVKMKPKSSLPFIYFFIHKAFGRLKMEPMQVQKMKKNMQKNDFLRWRSGEKEKWGRERNEDEENAVERGEKGILMKKKKVIKF
jgi:hypothetical protein